MSATASSIFKKTIWFNCSSEYSLIGYQPDILLGKHHMAKKGSWWTGKSRPIPRFKAYLTRRRFLHHMPSLFNRLVEPFSGMRPPSASPPSGHIKHFYHVRDRYNSGEHSSEIMLYLLTHCLKGAGLSPQSALLGWRNTTKWNSDNSYYEILDGVERCIDDEIPFDIPDSWAWVRLGIVTIITGGGTPDKMNSHFWNGEIPWATVKDIKGDELLNTIDHITRDGLDSKAGISVCEVGDLIVATRLVPGKSLVCKIRSSINQDLKRIQTSLEVKYMHYWFRSSMPSFMKIGQGTTVPGIKVEDLENALFPIPPFCEQERIVACIEELMVKVESLW